MPSTLDDTDGLQHGLQQRAKADLEPSSWAFQYLNPHTLRRLQHQAQRTLLLPDQVLYEIGQPIERVYFPNHGLVSLSISSGSTAHIADIKPESRGRSATQLEVAMVGREGEVGLLEALTSSGATYKTQVRMAGTAYWMTPQAVQEEFGNNGRFHLWALRFLAALMEQQAQVTLCNAYHSTSERLCRWLLSAQERTQDTTIPSAHKSIALALGTRRSSVTHALGELSQQGLLTLRRGEIELLDLKSLREHSCSCSTALSQSLENLRTFTLTRG